MSSKSSSNSIEISKSNFFKDEAIERGGSIFISAQSKIIIDSNNFTQTKAGINGMVILIDFLSQVLIKNNNLYIEKEIINLSAFYVLSTFNDETNSEKIFEIDGECFTSEKRNTNDNTVDYLVYNVSQSSNFSITGATCFQKSREESILIVNANSTSVVIDDDSVFNCNKCDGIVPVESESYFYSEFEPTSEVQSLESSSEFETATELQSFSSLESSSEFEPTETTTDVHPTQIPDD